MQNFQAHKHLPTSLYFGRPFEIYVMLMLALPFTICETRGLFESLKIESCAISAV